MFYPCTSELSAAASVREAIYQSFFYKLKSVFVAEFFQPKPLSSYKKSIQMTIYTLKGTAVLAGNETCNSSG